MLRLIWLIGFAFWTGGFVFYTSYVVPTLIRELGESAIITRHIALIFNKLGAVVLTYWFVALWQERKQTAWRGTALSLLALNSLLLAGLCLAYGWVSSAPQKLADEVFYFRHRIYLWMATLQVVLSVASLAISLRRWQLADRAAKPTGD